MPTTNGTNPAVEPAVVLERSRERFPELDGELLEELAATAARSAAGRGLADRRMRLIAAHVTAARLAGSHLARVAPGALMRADAPAVRADAAEQALGEHLYARLEPEELLVAALTAARGMTVEQAAQALALEVDELRALLESAIRQAAELTLAYHHELICEPAALSAAHHPAAATAAVSEHLSGCRSCRSEFEERVRAVLALAGALVKPLPPLRAPAAQRRALKPLRGRRAAEARVPVRPRIP